MSARNESILRMTILSFFTLENLYSKSKPINTKEDY